jgi:hypothetical protein
MLVLVCQSIMAGRQPVLLVSFQWTDHETIYDFKIPDHVIIQKVDLSAVATEKSLMCNPYLYISWEDFRNNGGTNMIMFRSSSKYGDTELSIKRTPENVTALINGLKTWQDTSLAFSKKLAKMMAQIKAQEQGLEYVSDESGESGESEESK